MNVSVIWPLNYGPDYTEYWANTDDWTTLWAVQYGYAVESNAASGISIGQQLWNMGFRWLNVSASLSAFDQSGVCDGSIAMQWDAWGYDSTGDIIRYTRDVLYMIYPDKQPIAGYHAGWDIGSGTDKRSTATFTRKLSLRPTRSTSGTTYTYWASSAGVYLHMNDVWHPEYAGMLKLNSFNFYFSKS